jgi:hypothetical protein
MLLSDIVRDYQLSSPFCAVPYFRTTIFAFYFTPTCGAQPGLYPMSTVPKALEVVDAPGRDPAYGSQLRMVGVMFFSEHIDTSLCIL